MFHGNAGCYRGGLRSLTNGLTQAAIGHAREVISLSVF
jgi:hypothetical protein